MPPFRLGKWLILPSLNRVTEQSDVVQVEPRIIHVLVCLASRPGAVISREELLETIWGETVVGEEVLTVAVSELRRILGDSARAPRFVETIRKGGYRLVTAPTVAEEASSVATAQLLPPEATVPAAAELPATPASRHGRQSTWRRTIARGWRRGAAWLLLPSALAIALLTWLHLSRPAAPILPELLEGVPFTTYRGSEVYPSLSPDGTQVTFAWRGEDGENFDIYVKQKNTESPLRLTDHPGPDWYPTWSPDGSTIAFFRQDEQTAIYTIPAIGGTERRLTFVHPSVAGLDWSPDGKLLAFSAAPQPDQPYLIHLLSLETLETHDLTAPKAQFTCDSSPAFSPDGETVAFVRGDYSMQRNIFLIPTAGGEERQLTSFQRQVSGIDWTPDGRDIIFAAAPIGNLSLWRVTVADGAVNWLPTRSIMGVNPSVAARGNALVYEEMAPTCDVWCQNISEEARDDSSAAPLISSTRMDYAADFSPDGNRIAFVSQRSGSREIWVCDIDGRNQRQLTTFDGTYVVRPRWSPDGRHLAFTATPAGYAAVFVLEVDGCIPHRLSDCEIHEKFSAWSHDGEWLYFSQLVGGVWNIWKMDTGGKQRTLVTDNGLLALHESSDGEYLYYYRGQDQSIRELTLASGEERSVVDHSQMRLWYDEVVVDEGVYAIQYARGGNVVVFLDFATDDCVELAPSPAGASPNLSLSPDRRQIIFDRSEETERDLILVEDFR